jgi:hypothetical protein
VRGLQTELPRAAFAGSSGEALRAVADFLNAAPHFSIVGKA